MPRAGSLVLSAADTLASVWEETTKLKDNEEIQNKPASTIVNIYNWQTIQKNENKFLQTIKLNWRLLQQP